MEEVTFYYLLVVVGVFASACSQLLLKKSANIKRDNFIASIINWRVLLAYTIFFGSLFVNITAMGKGVNLKDLPILESLGYVFVPLLSFVFLKETISRRSIISIVLIIVGVCLFYL